MDEDFFGREVFEAFTYNLFTPGKSMDNSEASLCVGDSGGPVYRYLNNNKLIVVGVNSQYIYKDSKHSYFNLHTRLSGVSSWLKEIIDVEEE